MSVEYEWDEEKLQTNRLKHRVDFADAVAVFADPFAVTVEDRRFAERCFATIGTDALGRTHVVVYTWRGAKRIRVISARKATASERRLYQEYT